MCFEKEALEINGESGPLITSTEVKHGMKKLKNNKATGTDLIAAEMLKALEDEPLGKLTQLCTTQDIGQKNRKSQYV